MLPEASFVRTIQMSPTVGTYQMTYRHFLHLRVAPWTFHNQKIKKGSVSLEFDISDFTL